MYVSLQGQPPDFGRAHKVSFPHQGNYHSWEGTARIICKLWQPHTQRNHLRNFKKYYPKMYPLQWRLTTLPLWILTFKVLIYQSHTLSFSFKSVWVLESRHQVYLHNPKFWKFLSVKRNPQTNKNLNIYCSFPLSTLYLVESFYFKHTVKE